MTRGGQAWVTAFEKHTAGFAITVGDIKTILCHQLDKNVVKDIFASAKLGGALSSNDHDAKPLDKFRTGLWQAIKAKYPTEAEPNKLNQYKWTTDTSGLNTRLPDEVERTHASRLG